MSQRQPIPHIGSLPVWDAGVATQSQPAGPIFRVFQTWCCKGSPLTANARHVLLQIARRMKGDSEGRQVAFMGERRLVEDTGAGPMRSNDRKR